MSMKQLDAFYKKVIEDKDLKDKLLAVKLDMDEEYIEKMIKIAQNAGYDIISEDIKTSFTESKKLDDSELDVVASGCSSVCGEVCGSFMGHWIGQQR